MATIFRLPICTWQSGRDTVSVRVIDDGYDDLTVTSKTVKDAVGQIKEYFGYLSKTDSWRLFDPDFFDPELRILKFSVLPEYNHSGRRFPCRDAMQFRMPCVIGKRENESPVGCLPSLGIFFDYHREDSYEKLAIHIAQRVLSGKNPRELSRFLNPGPVELEQLTVAVKDPGTRLDTKRNYQPLSDVADHIGSDTFRRSSNTWEREDEVYQLAQLLGEESASVCIVGPPGCGKTSILIEAARKVERQQDSGGERRRFWITSGARLIAGMRWLGQWEERLEEVIRQLAQIEGVLCIENLSELTRLGGKEAESSLAAFFAPYLQYQELRIVVEATPEEFDACERVLPGLTDRLQIIKLNPFDSEQSKQILKLAAENHTRNDKVVFGPASATRIFALFQRFQPYVAFPGKVIQFVAGVVDKANIDGVGEITIPLVEDAFSRYSGLPGFLTHSDEPFDPEDMVSFFSRRVIAQPAAVSATIRTVAKFATGLNDPNRPIGVLLFCGPTGVGKTQMVRSLGDYLFPNRPENERIIRLDMSEYAGYDASERLLGKRYGQPSDLIKRVRANPFCILLLDEIEKAGDEVFDIFLSVFEEGRLTDPLGRVSSFQSSLIVMTSNLGSGASGNIGFSGEGKSETAVGKVDPAAVTNFFRPEFFNRIDQTIYFDPLERDSIFEIAKKEIGELSKREGLADANRTLDVSKALITRIAEAGFDPVYGARPLQRAVEDYLTIPLAKWLIENPKVEGRISATWDRKAKRTAFQPKK
ncbi:MAG: AAA family ATPase [Verrucomicrobiales bacterium]|nr:AAA family ATPase [Verrucomicrobiales bacterium]